MPKHTKGPWVYFPATNYEGFAIAPLGTLPTLAAVQAGCRLSDGSRSHVVNVSCHNFPGETEANAKLIAAAPELFELLKSIVASEWTTTSFAEHSQRMDMARSLIASIER